MKQWLPGFLGHGFPWGLWELFLSRMGCSVPSRWQLVQLGRDCVVDVKAADDSTRTTDSQILHLDVSGDPGCGQPGPEHGSRGLCLLSPLHASRFQRFFFFQKATI